MRAATSMRRHAMHAALIETAIFLVCHHACVQPIVALFRQHSASVSACAASAFSWWCTAPRALECRSARLRGRRGPRVELASCSVGTKQAWRAGRYPDRSVSLQRAPADAVCRFCAGPEVPTWFAGRAAAAGRSRRSVRRCVQSEVRQMSRSARRSTGKLVSCG